MEELGQEAVGQGEPDRAANTCRAVVLRWVQASERGWESGVALPETSFHGGVVLNSFA